MLRFLKFNALLIALSFVSCKDEVAPPKSEKPTEPVAAVEVEKIETLFDEKTFGDSNALVLLKELNLCGEPGENLETAPCTPEYFKFFKLKKSVPLKDAFMLLIKSEVGGIAIRRLLIFERENGLLVKVNGFTANLLERRSKSSEYDELLLRFPDVEEDKRSGKKEFMRYDCVFSWTGNKYEYQYVEAIRGDGWGGNVRLDDRAETSKEILKTLEQNQMIF